MGSSSMDIVINAEIEALPDGHAPIKNYGNFYHHISVCLGHPNDFPPVADLLKRYHGLKGRWLVVSPIHWQATHNDAMILASGHELQLTEQQARLWFTAFSDFIAEVNMKAFYHDAYTWLLQCDEQPQIVAKAVGKLQHQSMMPELKALDETLFWQRFITESQMYFSANSLNKNSTQRYPINGIWIWGNAILSGSVQKSIVCYDPNLVELAKILSTNVSQYDPLSSYKKDRLLLCNELSQKQLEAIQTQVRQRSVRWYWNNIAYQSQPFGLSSLIRRFFKKEFVNAY